MRNGNCAFFGFIEAIFENSHSNIYYSISRILAYLKITFLKVKETLNFLFIF